MKLSKSGKNKRLIIVVISLLILVGGVLTAWLYFRTNLTINKQTKTEQSKSSDKDDKSKVVHFAAMGDMLAHDTIIANARTDKGYDFSAYFRNIRPAYVNSDVVFCNQEGPSAGEKYGISGYPTFNAPIEFSSGLKMGGCNVINLANNHMGDKGTAVINATIDNWDSLRPLAISGANKSPDDQNNDVGFFTVKGIKIGFLAFADFSNKSIPNYSVNIYHDEGLVRRLISAARKNSDIVIVSMHWGTEDSSEVNNDQVAQTNLLAALGADIVIGTGPHVLQREETVIRPDGGKMVVWYSLGNMLSSQLKTNELIGGIAGMDISKDTNGKTSVSNLTFVPTYMHYEWTAQQADNGDLSARKNAMIYLLNNSESPLSRSLLNTTVAKEKQYVIDILGGNVKVK